jgi:predicted  nucleic acid-binding Zn-ribbon protein
MALEKVRSFLQERRVRRFNKKAHEMTPARRAALKKAILASAKARSARAGKRVGKITKEATRLTDANYALQVKIAKNQQTMNELKKKAEAEMARILKAQERISKYGK